MARLRDEDTENAPQQAPAAPKPRIVVRIKPKPVPVITDYASL